MIHIYLLTLPYWSTVTVYCFEKNNRNRMMSFHHVNHYTNTIKESPKYANEDYFPESIDISQNIQKQTYQMVIWLWYCRCILKVSKGKRID